MFGECPVKEIPKEWQCPFNAWVKCPEKKKCTQCGWNPKVENERMARRFGIQPNK